MVEYAQRSCINFGALRIPNNSPASWPRSDENPRPLYERMNMRLGWLANTFARQYQPEASQTPLVFLVVPQLASH